MVVLPPWWLFKTTMWYEMFAKFVAILFSSYIYFNSWRSILVASAALLLLGFIFFLNRVAWFLVHDTV